MSEFQSDAELRQTRPERLVVHAEIRTAEDGLRAWVRIFIGVLQQVENLENELRTSRPSESQSFRGSEIPREKTRLMKREPRQQLPVDHRPIRLEAAVGHAVAVEIIGTVDREGEARARRPRGSQRN